MITAIYVRQSIDKKDSISIESQIDFCKKEINEEKLKVYSDKGFSGKNTDRPKFKEMITDIKNGLITKVIVYKIDRISRNLLDFANITDTFKKYNVSFTSCNEKFDTSTPIGNAMLNIVMVFAQLERETIQARVKDNYYARGAKGMYMGGRAPYGFTKIETKLEGKKTYTYKNNMEQLPHLLKMYELYSSTNMSLGKVSDYMNKNNIPAAEGGSWDSSKISRILRSPVYVKADADIYTYYRNKGCIITNQISDFIGINGCYLYGKREANERKYTNVKDHVLSIALHPGVIDSDTWLICQNKLDSNRQIKNTGQGKYTWLSGIIKCGYCNYAMTVTVGRGSVKYLNCRGKSNLKICNGFNKTMFVEDIEAIVKKYIFKRLEEINCIDLPNQITKNSVVNGNKLKIIEIEEQIQNLINQLAKSKKISMKYINEKISSLDNEKKLLDLEMKKNTITKTKSHSKDEMFEKIYNWNKLSMEEQKNICRVFIDKIYIKEDEIKIIFN